MPHSRTIVLFETWVGLHQVPTYVQLPRKPRIAHCNTSLPLPSGPLPSMYVCLSVFGSGGVAIAPCPLHLDVTTLFCVPPPPPGWAAMPRVASVGGRGRLEGGWRSSSRSRSCFKLRAADAAARLSPLKRTLSHLYTTNHTLNAPPQQTKRDRPAPARQGKMQNPTKERYFDPQALLADDTVRPGPPAHGVVDLAPACPHPEPPAPPFPVQLVPTTFRFSVKTLGKALDPTCTSTDVSAGGCGALRAGGTAGARRSGCTAHAPHAAPAAPTSPLTAPLPPHCTCSCRRTTSSTCRCGW
jgi:hypothetical protein